jgi:peptide/nickel transport system ATP-binding protein
MSKGDLVEVGPREQILRSPQQDYTRRLLAAVPVPNPAEQKLRREERDRLLAAAAPAGTTAAEHAVADGQRVQAFEDEQVTNAGRYEGNIRPRGGSDGV